MSTALANKRPVFTVANGLAALIIVVAILWLLPVVWVLAMSFKPNSELMRSTAGFLPIPFTFDNYVSLLSLSATPRWLFNSLLVAVSMTVVTLLLASTAGYAFARLEFPGRRVLFVAVLAGLMVPEQAVFIPLHALFLPGATTIRTSP
jgi:multiple sugar transport system permease protein